MKLGFVVQIEDEFKSNAELENEVLKGLDLIPQEDKIGMLRINTTFINEYFNVRIRRHVRFSKFCVKNKVEDLVLEILNTIPIEYKQGIIEFEIVGIFKNKRKE